MALEHHPEQSDSAVQIKIHTGEPPARPPRKGCLTILNEFKSGVKKFVIRSGIVAATYVGSGLLLAATGTATEGGGMITIPGTYFTVVGGGSYGVKDLTRSGEALPPELRTRLLETDELASLDISGALGPVGWRGYGFAGIIAPLPGPGFRIYASMLRR